MQCSALHCTAFKPLNCTTQDNIATTLNCTATQCSLVHYSAVQCTILSYIPGQQMSKRQGSVICDHSKTARELHKPALVHLTCNGTEDVEAHLLDPMKIGVRIYLKVFLLLQNNSVCYFNNNISYHYFITANTTWLSVSLVN